MKRTILPLFAAFMIYLGSYRGQLALFHSGNDIPFRVYPVQIHMLPEADQLKIASGIGIRDSLHLAQLLEDYLS